MKLKRFIAERQVSIDMLDLKLFSDNDNSNFVEAWSSPNYSDKEITFNFIHENANNSNRFQLTTISEDFDYKFPGGAARYDESNGTDNLYIKSFKDNSVTPIGQGTIKNGPIPPPYNKLVHERLLTADNFTETNDLLLTKIDLDWSDTDNINLHIELKNNEPTRRWKFYAPTTIPPTPPQYSIESYDYEDETFYFIALHVEEDTTPGASINILADFTINFPQIGEGIILTVVKHATLIDPGPSQTYFNRKLFFKFENSF